MSFLSSTGSYPFPSPGSVRFILAFWWLFCIILLATYRSNLIAFLAVDKLRTPFDNLQGLVEENTLNLRYGTLGETSFSALFQVALIA